MSQIGFESDAAAHGVDLGALKTLTPGTSGITPQADVPDVADVPTMAQHNALLAALRAAGVLIVAEE